MLALFFVCLQAKRNSCIREECRSFIIEQNEGKRLREKLLRFILFCFTNVQANYQFPLNFEIFSKK